MKILYVCTTTDRGGAETALHALALSAKKAGHLVHIISLKPLGTVADQMRKDGLEVSSLEVQGRFSPVQFAGALARLLQQVQQFHPDIVHAFLYRAIQLCRLAKRKASFALVTTPHYQAARLPYWKRLLDRALKDADTISTAESQETADALLKKLKYVENKVRLVRNGADSIYFAPNAEQRKKYRKNNDFFDYNTVFCCVARLAAEKNQELLLQSFLAVYTKNPSVRLMLVGDGPERKKLENFVAKNQLEKVVFFIGEVTDVRPYLQLSDVFVLPSLRESLPLALLEAGLCGLPAIVSKKGDMAQVVKHGETGFVFNGKDPILLSVLMAELTENKDLRQKMGQAARQFIMEKYPAPENIYLQIYEELK